MLNPPLLKSVFALCVFCFSIQCYSQGITDTRKKTESFHRLQPPNIRAEVASFTFGGIRESAQAPQLKRINPTIITRDSLVIEGEGIYAKVRLEPFDSKSHKIVYDDDEKTPIKIDRRPYYGDYGTMPRTSIASIIVVIDGDTAAIPPTAYSDLKNMQFKYFDKGQELTADAVFVSKNGQDVYLYLFSQNKKGNYEVTYIFSNKRYYRRVLDYDFL
jgi:hypothetical protein